MFYKLDSLDLFGSNPWKRSDNRHVNGTFGGDMNQLAMVTQYLLPDAELVYDDKITDDEAKELLTRVEFFGFDFELPNLLPDG